MKSGGRAGSFWLRSPGRGWVVGVDNDEFPVGFSAIDQSKAPEHPDCHHLSGATRSALPCGTQQQTHQTTGVAEEKGAARSRMTPHDYKLIHARSSKRLAARGGSINFATAQASLGCRGPWAVPVVDLQDIDRIVVSPESSVAVWLAGIFPRLRNRSVIHQRGPVLVEAWESILSACTYGFQWRKDDHEVVAARKSSEDYEEDVRG